MADFREPQFFARNIFCSVVSAGTVLTLPPHAGCDAGNGHVTASGAPERFMLKPVTSPAAAQRGGTPQRGVDSAANRISSE